MVSNETSVGKVSDGRRDGAVERAFSVLEALVNEGPSSALAVIAARAGLPKPTVHRLLQTLISLGYARQLSEGLYTPDVKLLGLATRVR